MSVGPTSGIAGSAAGAPLSQTAGSENERAQKEASAIQRQVEGEAKAEKAAGIGETKEDAGTSDRDADGRRLWEQGIQEEKDSLSTSAEASDPPRQVKDPTGNCGNSLDLTG